MTEVKLYRPSNGTEGEIFMDAWCGKCAKFERCPEVGGRHCDIQMRSFIHGIDEPEYPGEWRHDKDGEPYCTAFSDVNPPTASDTKYLVWLAERDAKASVT